MIRSILTLTAALSVMTSCLFPTSATAQSYDQSIVAIFGSGNPNTGWTVDTDNGITLALRAKNRETASTSNTLGVYAEPAGLQAPNFNRARWNFEFSVSNLDLDGKDYYVALDNDPSVGINFNPIDISLIPDNSFGIVGTANGAGVEGLWSTLAPSNTIVQQSHNIVFYPTLGFDPNANATYEIELYAVESGAGPDGDRLVSVAITVVVGTGGKTVSELIGDIGLNFEGNHGEYVVAVDNLLEDLYNDGVINKSQKKNLHVAAAQSGIGN